MIEATCIFIHCAKTSAPSCLLKKYAKRYKEITQEVGEGTPWDEVGQWVETENWQISCGLNFGQFVDAMAKCGALAFSGQNFTTALPEFEDKVSHFLVGYMKLLETNKWRSRVDKKLRNAKKTAEEFLANSSNVPVLQK